MQIKVCGMTQLEQILKLDELGVDYAGLIFYAKSPRDIGRSGLDAALLTRPKLQIKKVGVFVDADADTILRAVDQWQLSMVQLHGHESEVFCQEMSKHVPVMKAFRISEGSDVDAAVGSYADTADRYLFDASGRHYGGNGTQFDWQILEQKQFDKPWFLSGGIGFTDAVRVKQFAERNHDMAGVDVNSRFEISPGVKDMNLIEAFCKELR